MGSCGSSGCGACKGQRPLQAQRRALAGAAAPARGPCRGHRGLAGASPGPGTKAAPGAQPPLMPAEELVNAVLRTSLPVVRRGVELLLLKANRQGGLPLFTDTRDGNPVYRLRVLKSDSTELRPGDIIREMSVEVRGVRAFSAASAEEPSRLPADVRAFAGEVLTLDLEVDIQMDFREEALHQEGSDGSQSPSKIEFQVHSERWYSPTLGNLSINTLHAHAHVRIWMSLHFRKLIVAFLEEPHVQWDIEAGLLAAGLPLPSGLENGLAAWSVRKVLSWFDADHPLVLPMGQSGAGASHHSEVLEAIELGAATVPPKS